MYKILILFLFVFYWCSVYAEEPICTRSQTKNKVWMKQVNDHVGYCGIFAFRALLHQFRCETDRLNCRLPSILDLILKSKGMESRQFGQDLTLIDDLSATLDVRVNRIKDLKDENCLPFLDFFKPPSDLDRSDLQDVSWQNSFQNAWNKIIKYDYKTNCFDGSKICISKYDNPKVKAEKVSKYSEQVLNEFVVSRKCKASNVPQFNYKSIQPAQIKNIVKMGKSVMVRLKIFEEDGKTRGNHSVLVTNLKTVCCKNFCSNSYQLLDSLGFYWSKTHYDSWVSEGEFLELIDHDNPQIIYLQERPKYNSSIGLLDKTEDFR